MSDNCTFPKTSLLAEVIGAADELVCALGMARHDICRSVPPLSIEASKLILALQSDLFKLSSYTVNKTIPISAQDVDSLKKLSAYFKKHTPEVGDFVIVGATKLDIASLDLCRAIARRLEREFLIWREDFIYGDIEVVAEWLNSLSGTIWDFGRYIEANYSRSVKLSDFRKSPKDYGFLA